MVEYIIVFIKKKFFVALVLVLFHTCLLAQDKPKKSIFRDSLDNKLDFSEFLLHPKGFIPFMQPITEPALGHIGIMVAPIFIKPSKYQTKEKYVPPNITAFFGAYTANKSWLFGAFRMGFVPQHGIKYTVATGYGAVNLSYYRELPVVGEKEFEFNFRSFPFFGSILKQIGGSNFYVGLEYLFMNSDISPNFDFETLPEFVSDKDLKSNISSPGIVLEFDKRDNIFTPDKGLFVNTSFHVNDNWTGSDFSFHNFELIALKYIQLKNNWISGFRFQTDQQFGDAPFYAQPGIQLRGVPAARYQGTSTYILETEQRYDVSLRWSGVAFGGMAKAVNDNQSFNEADFIYNYGAGFRYLIARKFKIRVGVDVAWSNNDFGYYIVCGSAWNQRN
ncbi:BamA/TamA family outer membrane protein [Galbibacter pacificus]|uniref:BamA/TamA family outer membrane protein n=1 Tax=Galbibacter pacificus TaxID=2996052 RepID=A0ABT6FTL0_9FLAO|nr:BamA/TamA family outer membrane protein [Galbibacter pacificus]MDG3582435.1 BamA/TamA family outer membrane protein [Galbibacter pacificus]MDG3586447.1 BamA/TamA family outer membrane protein [Galbibacter pacificus]